MIRAIGDIISCKQGLEKRRSVLRQEVMALIVRSDISVNKQTLNVAQKDLQKERTGMYYVDDFRKYSPERAAGDHERFN